MKLKYDIKNNKLKLIFAQKEFDSLAGLDLKKFNTTYNKEKEQIEIDFPFLEGLMFLRKNFIKEYKFCPYQIFEFANKPKLIIAAVVPNDSEVEVTVYNLDMKLLAEFRYNEYATRGEFPLYLHENFFIFVVSKNSLYAHGAKYMYACPRWATLDYEGNKLIELDREYGLKELKKYFTPKQVKALHSNFDEYYFDSSLPKIEAIVKGLNGQKFDDLFAEKLKMVKDKCTTAIKQGLETLKTTLEKQDETTSFHEFDKTWHEKFTNSIHENNEARSKIVREEYMPAYLGLINSLYEKGKAMKTPTKSDGGKGEKK